MGLDMYLYKETYIWRNGPLVEEFTLNHPSIQTERVRFIIEGFGEWRKANQIHQWFVDNVQNGEDDCRKYHLETDQLQELLTTVERVQNDHTLARELLPSQEGFFFGSTDYDEFYFDDLEHTRKILTTALAEQEGGEFQYESSW